MGARQSKRSVDITTTPKKGEAEVGAVPEEKIEKLGDADIKNLVSNGAAAHTDIEFADKDEDAKEVKENGLPESEGEKSPEVEQPAAAGDTPVDESSVEKSPTTPSATEAVPEKVEETPDSKKSKEKVKKKKWSLRSISFSKKDKSKPSKEIEKSEDVKEEKAEEVTTSPITEAEPSTENTKPEEDNTPAVTNGEASKAELTKSETSEIKVEDIPEPVSIKEEIVEKTNVEEKEPQPAESEDVAPVSDKCKNEVGSEMLASNSASETTPVSNSVTVPSLVSSAISFGDKVPEVPPEVVKTEGCADSITDIPLPNDSPNTVNPTLSPDIKNELKTEILEEHVNIKKDEILDIAKEGNSPTKKIENMDEISESNSQNVEEIHEDKVEDDNQKILVKDLNKDVDIVHPVEKKSEKSLNSEISNESSLQTEESQNSIKTEETNSIVSMQVSIEEQMPVVSSAGDVILNPIPIETESNLELAEAEDKLDLNSANTVLSNESSNLSTIKEAMSENSQVNSLESPKVASNRVSVNDSLNESSSAADVPSVKEIPVEDLINNADSLPDLSTESLPSLPPEPSSELLEPMSLPPIESLPEPITNDIKHTDTTEPEVPVPLITNGTNGLTNGVNGLYSPDDKSDELPPPITQHIDGSTKQIIADSVPLENAKSNADNSELLATSDVKESVQGGD